MALLTRLFHNRFVLAMTCLLAIATVLAFDAYVEAGMYVDRELARLQSRGEPTEPQQVVSIAPPIGQNAAPLYEAAVTLCTGQITTSVLETVPLTVDRSPDTCRADVAAAATVFRLLAEGYERPSCIYSELPFDGGARRMPNFIAIRRMAQLASLKAMLDVREHRYAEALATTAHMLRFEGSYARHSGLIEEMIMVASVNFTLQPLEAMAEAGVRADYGPVLRELAVARSARSQKFTWWVTFERINAIVAFRHGKEFIHEAGDTTEMSWGTLAIWSAYQIVPQTMLRMDERAYLEAMASQDEALQSARLDINTAAWSQDRLAARRTAIHDACKAPPQWALLSCCMVPNSARAFDQLDTMLHRMDCLAGRCRGLQQL